ncbi:uncharacterized protein ASCRUDRAFT_95279 [Ascoidea rubescens DSM 1968]|uniref:Uncharacterized protein n=1 Tax=Ascoidea rubescens DSM 1968 TaxID=1344418 RepID=A0A1D2VP78_9ASCO|nr:hypothetical protein ASCRUDRAFT_95279 [Ascoidea rubescens DSM 1968]ODV63422.1 hypothetical protein ASCRUDRAFT_95279 [Ascoidea rubescens DSM 1968]
MNWVTLNRPLCAERPAALGAQRSGFTATDPCLKRNRCSSPDRWWFCGGERAFNAYI